MPGRWVWFLAALAFHLAPTAPAGAADIRAHAELDRTEIAVGDVADLSVTVEGVQDAPAPSLGTVDGLSIRYVGPSSQLSIVNGRASSSVTHHFSVSALKAGTFTIAPITIDYGGQRYDAGSVSVRAGTAPGAASGTGGQGAPAIEGLQLLLTAPRTRAYLHERLPALLTLTVGAVQVADVHFPTIGGDGFALDPLREPAQRREQTAHGPVQVIEFPTTITPLRTGTLVVGPATMELSVLVRGRGRDAVFPGFFAGQRRSVTLQSAPLQLDVLPLPDNGKPPDFSGAVGRFELQVEAGPRQLVAGDPVTITATIRGDGNLEGITPPQLSESDVLKVYPVQTLPQTAGTPAAASGGGQTRSVFEQVVIPERAGAMTLPGLRFSYFDPEVAAYRTLTAPAIALTVQPPAHAAVEPPVGATIAPAAPSAQVETLGRDIVFIKDAPGTLRPIGGHRYDSLGFWAAQLVPLAAWLGVVFWDRRRRRLHADPRWARFTTAGRSARRAIAAAEASLRAGDRTGFYDRLAHAMREYLSAKLDLPPGTVTADAIAERARERGVPAELAAGLHELFATCERVRFAPNSAGDGDVRDSLARAEALVRALERERKPGATIPPIAATVLVMAAGIVFATTWAGAENALPSPNTLFFHGNALYGEERYAEAAAEYERILAAGLESGPLYFNLGNAYFRAGDVGHAILAYERARRLMPGDPDLRANLRFARDGADPYEGPLLGRVLFPLAARASTDTLLLASSLLCTLVLVLLTARRLVPSRERLGMQGAVGTTLLLVIVGSSAVYRLVTIDLPAYAVVVAPHGATVRFEPSASGTAHFETKTGDVLRMVTTRERWTQVVRPDGARGWIEADGIAPL